MPLGTLGLNLDGMVEVPTGDLVPGWSRLGPSPGQVGSSVILGHVISHSGPGVFFNLRTLPPGDQVQVSLTDGDVATFAVTNVATYTKTQCPADQVYASHGVSSLQLVTCGGDLRSADGSLPVQHRRLLVVRLSHAGRGRRAVSPGPPVT